MVSEEKKNPDLKGRTHSEGWPLKLRSQRRDYPLPIFNNRGAQDGSGGPQYSEVGSGKGG